MSTNSHCIDLDVDDHSVEEHEPIEKVIVVINQPDITTKLLNKKRQNEFNDKIVIIGGLIIVNTPIIICDFYFALSDNTCVNEKILGINLKQYLLSRAIVTIVATLVYNIYVCLNGYKYVLCSIIIFIFNITCLLILLVWNIIGAILYWGSFYNTYNCSSIVSTYLFVTIIIRIICNLAIILKYTCIKYLTTFNKD